MDAEIRNYHYILQKLATCIQHVKILSIGSLRVGGVQDIILSPFTADKMSSSALIFIIKISCRMLQEGKFALHRFAQVFTSLPAQLNRSPKIVCLSRLETTSTACKGEVALKMDGIKRAGRHLLLFNSASAHPCDSYRFLIMY